MTDFFDSFRSSKPIKTKTKVVHFKKDDFDIYIGRLRRGKFNKWAYPKELRNSFKSDASRKDIVAAYEDYLINNEDLMSSLHEIQGKILGCWCKNKMREDGTITGKSCHGDILKKYADEL